MVWNNDTAMPRVWELSGCGEKGQSAERGPAAGRAKGNRSPGPREVQNRNRVIIP